MALIQQPGEKTISIGQLLLISGKDAPNTLALALDYVGRDEGKLLRVIEFDIPPAVKADAEIRLSVMEKGTASIFPNDNIDVANFQNDRVVELISRVDRLCGIVDEETSIETLYFEVISERDIAEGRIVETFIRDQKVRERHAVFFGKGSNCENPVLIRLNDRGDFLNALAEG